MRTMLLPHRPTVGPDSQKSTGFLFEEATMLIREAMLRFDGNRMLAARALGISRTTLWRKLKTLGIGG